MSFFGRFFRQPAGHYRNFQIVFLILTLNFAIPTLSYVFAPEVAVAQFSSINDLLGGVAYAWAEAEVDSRLWRYLGAANVATLALMCFLLQLNLRRFYAVLVPLTFMKALAATLWLAGFIAHPGYRIFLAAAILDFVTSAAFVIFARTARRQIEGMDDGVLVPAPVDVGPRLG
jgi:hypothetical protein